MKCYREDSLNTFPFWAGAVSNYNDLSKHETAEETLEEFLNDLTTITDMSETDINDFICFDLEDWLIEESFKNADGEWLD